MQLCRSNHSQHLLIDTDDVPNAGQRCLGEAANLIF